MKKFLLFAAAATFAAAANAQVLQLNAEDFGFGSDAVDCEAGTVWGTTDYGTFENAFTTQHKAVDCKNNNYNQVVFDGENIVLTKGGIQGQDNPKDADGSNPGISQLEPIQGAVIRFKATKNGYVYVVSKLSSNKNYYVFEEGTAVGFTLAMEVEAEGLPQLLTYTAVGEGEYNALPDNSWNDWPENVYYNKILGQEKPGDIKKNGLGFIGFYCYEGCEYLVGAGGSKISWSGVYCADAPASSVVLQGTDAENPVEDFVLAGAAPVAEGITLWEGEAVCDDWKDQPYLLSDGGTELQAAGAEAGDVVRFFITPLSADWTLEIIEGHWGKDEAGNMLTWGNFAGYEDPERGRTYVDLQATGGCASLTLTEDMLAKIYTIGYWGGTFVGNGDDVTITKIDLVKGSGSSINTVVAEKANVSYNLFGQKANANGLVINNGKIVYIK